MYVRMPGYHKQRTDCCLGTLRYHHLLQRLARRQDRRTLLSHHAPAVRGSFCLHSRSGNDVDRSKIRGHDAYGPRRLHWLCRCPRVDL